MPLTGLHHVQVACPPGSEGDLRAFYGGVLGMTEVAKPEVLAARGGVWFRSGTAEVHCGDEVFNVAPGSFVLLPRGIPHWHQVSSDAPLRSLVMTTGQFEQYVVACGEPAQARQLPPPTTPDMGRAAAAGERFRIEVLGPPPATQRP